VVNLLHTDEEIEAKVAELVDRKVREFIQANVIETNLRLRERQLRTWRRNLILCVRTKRHGEPLPRNCQTVLSDS